MLLAQEVVCHKSRQQDSSAPHWTVETAVLSYPPLRLLHITLYLAVAAHAVTLCQWLLVIALRAGLRDLSKGRTDGGANQDGGREHQRKAVIDERALGVVWVVLEHVVQRARQTAAWQ